MEKFISSNKRIAKQYHRNQWSPSLSGYFVKQKLTDESYRLVKQDETNRGVTVNLAYNELFEVEQNEKHQVKKIVLISEEGLGKTSLCLSVFNDWACKKLFQQFTLLLYLPLHNKKVGEASSLVELIKLLYPSENEKSCTSLAISLEESKGKNVLIIADGWDKLCDSQRQDGSFFSKMLFGPKYSDLSVLLTIQSTSFTQVCRLTCIDQLVKMHRFNNATIEEYIKCELADENAVQSLLMQTQNNPLLGVVFGIPCICSTICHMWHASQESIPTTMSELYTKLTLHIISDNMVKRKYKSEIIHSFDTIPEKFKHSWKLLCKYAFQGLENNRRYIFQDEVHPKDVNSILCFGILQPSMSYFDTETFTFLHPNFQEYLAAQHIINLSPEVQLKVIQDFAGIDRFNLVWRFCIGLCMSSDHNSDTFKHLVCILCESRIDRLQLCHCAFEARSNIEVAQEVLKVLKPKRGSYIAHFGKVQNLYDCSAVIKIIANINEKVSIEVNFNKCSLNAQHLQTLKCALSSPSKVCLKGLDLSHNRLTDSSVSQLFKEAPDALKSLQKLYLRNNDIKNEAINSIIDTLKTSVPPTLTHLDLSCNPLTRCSLERIQQCVSSVLASLEVLFMRQSLTEDPEYNIKFLCTFAKSLSLECHSLQRLDLFGNDLGEPDSPALTEIISCLTGLRKDFDLHLNREYMSQVEENFVSVMEKSLREKGTIDHTVVHGMIIGPGRSGKDSLMRRLIKRGPPDTNAQSPSTGVLERVVKVEVKKHTGVAVAESYVSWRTLYHDEEALELMMSTTKSHSALDINDITFDECEEVASSDLVDYIIIPHDKLRTRDGVKLGTNHRPMKNDITYAFVSSQASRVYTSSVDDTKTESANDLLKKALKCRRMDALRDQLESSWTLYLTNTGGQLEYQELLPVLVCGPLVFFVTFPLNADLNKRYRVRHEDQSGIEKTYESPSTMINEILQLLSTVSALKNVEPKHNIKLKPKVFLVGTHKDKLPISEADQIIDRIDQLFQKKIEIYFTF